MHPFYVAKILRGPQEMATDDGGGWTAGKSRTGKLKATKPGHKPRYGKDAEKALGVGKKDAAQGEKKPTAKKAGGKKKAAERKPKEREPRTWDEFFDDVGESILDAGDSIGRAIGL